MLICSLGNLFPPPSPLCHILQLYVRVIFFFLTQKSTNLDKINNAKNTYIVVAIYIALNLKNCGMDTFQSEAI